MALIDPDTGELIPTQLFVGALGASSYTFAVATLSQELPVWLDCHVRMYEYLGRVAALTIPDNLRSGVTRPDRYEADINPSYRELAQYYGTCVIPERIRKRRRGKLFSHAEGRAGPSSPLPRARRAHQNIFEWIEVFHNRQRRHSTLGYRSPAEFEMMTKVA